ncbi:MAG: nicotinate mononucleotide-dependent phosphoribosyltransferase CobT [Candidatus Hodarchaeota archaeon]
MKDEIIYALNPQLGKKLKDKVEGKYPLFLCVIATTETAKIPGISAAGQNPDLTDYTPPADVELLYYRHCRCFHGIPVTPDGIPTPALITLSALQLSQIPFLVVNGGLKVTPKTPYIDVGGSPGNDITTGHAVKETKEVVERAKLVGKSLAESHEYLVIGESIPGGTTTALAVMLALGIDAEGKVSSSMSINPHTLKTETAKRGIQSAGIEFGGLQDDPVKAIESVGDPMQAATVGLVLGVDGAVPIFLAGGTQMAAVAALLHSLSPESLRQAGIATTRWIIEDKTSDIRSIVHQSSDIPVIAANLNFASSKHRGLKAYEQGVVKEGVGAGGAALAAILKSRNQITSLVLQRKIEEEYTQLVEGNK